MLKEGVTAPEFILNDTNGKEVKLSDFLGKRVVVYFYPKDNTPGCSRQAQAFARTFDEFVEMDIPVIGISKDSTASHIKFADKYNLPFILLSDPNLEAIKAYDVWQEKKMYGKVTMGVMRTTYLIDKNGIIEKVWNKAKSDTNADEILEYIKNE